ncbi:MAG: alpha/beta hydrolase [Lachnospiraceae bacterium]|nr:alpha/beta hydrolase [Lachnospiraceae bacterium]
MKKLAVFFPGLGYNHDKPLLYYARDIACECGFTEYVNVTYEYQADKKTLRGNDEKMAEIFTALYAQAAVQLSKISFDAFDEILFVSKSIGTAVAAAYAKEHHLKNIKHVFYTPLLLTYDHAPENAAAFIGTNDPWSNVPEVIRTSESKGIPVNVYEGLNHSLEGDDTLENIKTIKNVMKKTKAFINS